MNFLCLILILLMHMNFLFGLLCILYCFEFFFGMIYLNDSWNSLNDDLIVDHAFFLSDPEDHGVFAKKEGGAVRAALLKHPSVRRRQCASAAGKPVVGQISGLPGRDSEPHRSLPLYRIV